MANMKYMNTRIQLKYDTLAKWTENDPVLLAGELAVISLGNSHTTTTPDNGTHPILFKVGDGQAKFSKLPFASALAADVYSWAKAETKPEYQASEIKGLDEYIAGEIQDTNTDTQYRFTTDGDKLVVYKTLYTLGVAGAEEKVGEYEFLTAAEVAKTLENYYTKAEVDELLEDVRNAIPTELGVMSLTASGDSEITLAVDKATGDVTLTGAHATHASGEAKTASSATISGYGATGTIKVPKVVTNATGHVTEISEETVSITMPEAQSVSGENAIEVTGDAANQTVKLKVQNNKMDADGEYPLSNVYLEQDENGLYALVSPEEILDVQANSGITTEFYNIREDLAQLTIGLNLQFKSDLVEHDGGKYLQLVDSEFEDVIAEFDVTEFVKDGMLKSVVPSKEDNTLTFTWNTDGGETVTTVNLSEIADIYTGGSTNDITVSVSNENVITATLNKTFAERSELSGYKTVQEAKTGTLVGAQVVNTWSQDTNGVVTITTRDLTPANIGAYTTSEADAKFLTEAQVKAVKVDNATHADGATDSAKLGGVEAASYALKTDLPAEEDFGILSISGSNGITINDTNAQNPTIQLNLAEGGYQDTNNVELFVNEDGALAAALALSGAIQVESYDSSISASVSSSAALDAYIDVQVAEHGISAHHLKSEKDYAGGDAEVWVFCCGSSTVLV